jgi:putative ATP-dependent endonuclease of OLD family
MKIRHVSIRNFRGIKNLDWAIPDSSLICLIGKGDSTKSSILQAIQHTLHPNWDLSVSQYDFYDCDTENSITIQLSIGDLSKDFLKIGSFGLNLRGWDSVNLKLSDEPNDNLETVLTIQLHIDENFEPTWTAYNDRDANTPINQNERRKLNCGIIGDYSDQDLTWKRGSALSRLTENYNIKSILKSAIKETQSSIDYKSDLFSEITSASKRTEEAAIKLGVPVSDSYQPKLDIKNLRISNASLSIHDGDIPLTSLGLGSRRLLLCGIQQSYLKPNHITLFDELEHGLEPFRISRLLKEINADKSGQFFITTHSPIVLRELLAKDLFIVKKHLGGEVSITQTTSSPEIANNIQGHIRSSAEAFLSKKVLVCEGQTEVGVTRGYDNFKVTQGDEPLSFWGVSILNAGGGSKVEGLAMAFQNLGYDTAILADTDAKTQLSDASIQSLKDQGIETIVWKDDLCLEQRIYMDLPWEHVKRHLTFTKEILSHSVIDQIQSKYNHSKLTTIEALIESEDLRKAIGLAASKSNWYKNIALGELWFEIITESFTDEHFQKTDFYLKLETLWQWVKNAK